jgi:hypothetical protein
MLIRSCQYIVRTGRIRSCEGGCNFVSRDLFARVPCGSILQFLFGIVLLKLELYFVPLKESYDLELSSTLITWIVIGNLGWIWPICLKLSPNSSLFHAISLAGLVLVADFECRACLVCNSIIV